MLRWSVARSAGVDAHAGELAEAGVDAVDRLALGDDALRPPRRRPRRAGAAGRIERGSGAAIDGAPVGQRHVAGRQDDRSVIWPLQMRRVQRVEAHAVDELGRALDVPDREVAALAGLQRAGLVRAGPARARPRACTPARHSSTVSRNRVAAMFMVSSSEVSGEVPGLQSVASAIGTPCLRNSVDRRLLRLADEVEGAGQQHGDGAGLRHRRPRRPRRCIRGDRPTARRSAPRAPRRRGWRAGRHAASPAGPARCAASNTRAICSGEKAMPSQKASTASARPSAAIAGQHLVGRRGRCRRPCRRAPPAAARARRGRSCAIVTGALRPSRRAARSDLRFGVEVEPVAGLDLDRGRRPRRCSASSRGQRLARRGRPRSAARVARDGRDDAAARPGDLLIGRAGQPQLELVRAVAGIDEMGVAIDQAGRDPAALAVDRFQRPRRLPPAARASGPGIDDAAMRVGGHRAVLDDAEARQAAAMVASRALRQSARALPGRGRLDEVAEAIRQVALPSWRFMYRHIDMMQVRAASASQTLRRRRK